jgi:hypothetical protein
MQLEFSLSSLQQRALAIALALIPILLVLIGIGSFVWAQIEHHKRVVFLERELNRYQAAIDEAPNWERKLAEVRSAPQWQGIFLPGTAVTWANATSASPLARIITGNGGTVLQSRSDVRADGTTTQVDNDVTFTADITALTHILYTMRVSGPLFIIKRLVVHDQEGALSGQRTIPNKLRVELHVTGFGRPS